MILFVTLLKDANLITLLHTLESGINVGATSIPDSRTIGT